MDTKIKNEYEARGLDRRADLLERQANDREARAVWDFGGGSRHYLESLDRAEQHREQARQLRAQAARLRRQPSRSR